MIASGPTGQRPVYSISVAAELAGLAAPTLRLYEQRGLIEPARTEGGTRRYSDADVETAVRVSGLVERGVTLAAAGRVLDLEDDNARLAHHNASLRTRNTRLRHDIARLREDGGAMAEIRDDVPVEDAEEQLRGVEDAGADPTLAPTDGDLTEPARDGRILDPAEEEADEADLLEQHRDVITSEEDNPRDPRRHRTTS